MVISIQDVPPYERHLLFCSELDHARRPRRHRRPAHNAPAIDRPLPICQVQVAARVVHR
jgi:hypothetical protein